MKKIYYNWKEVEGMTLDVIQKISNSNWEPDYIVGITRGGLTPASLISHWYNDMPIHTLQVQLRDSEEYDCEINLWMPEDAFGYNIEPKNILIVDDINDSGATLQWIKKDWQQNCLPSSPRWDNEIWHHNVRFATLVDNLSSDFDVDYSSIEINKAEDPVWIVYPWEDWWMNE